MATIKEIAQLAGVSPSAVSRVLNKDETLMVSNEVRERIFAVSHKLQYVPPKQRRVNVNNGIVIGIADWQITVPGLSNIKYDFYQNIARRFSDSTVKLVTIKQGEDCTVDGVIAFGVFNKEDEAFLRKQSPNILFINSKDNDFTYDRIQVEYQSGLVNIVDYLMESRGHKEINYIGAIYDNNGITIGKTRYRSLKEILSDRGIYKPEDFHMGEFTRDSGHLLTLKAIGNKTLRKGIVVGNEEMAIGVIQALEDGGIDYSNMDIVVYRDIETAYDNFTSHTIIKMFPDFMWETALKMMIEKISGKRKQCYTAIMPTDIVFPFNRI